VTAQCTNCGNCSKKWQTITSVTNQFKIKAWWPGMTGKSVTTSYIVELYDKNRDIISTDEVTLVGNPDICEANSSNVSTTSVIDPLAPSLTEIGNYLSSKKLRLNNDGSFAIQSGNKVYNYKFKGSLPVLPQKYLLVSVMGDANGDGYTDYFVSERLDNGTYRKFRVLQLETTNVQ
ncbi:hypothetical protein QUF50_08330, partial [Thiotrichales bacterium HSG1]|nr:hypothetical protein [Thiotrichales bacterium HSG1]